MRIRKIHIAGFGKLDDYELEFEDGFQVIAAENEFGKSTIMMFIRMMFYGRAAGGQDVLKNARLKYRPWNGGSMGGMIEFEYGGELYRLEKEFGKSVSTDSVCLMNISLGKQIPLSKGEEAGMYFFGMDLEAFTKSVFIEKSIMETKVADRDYLAEKLGTLSDYGDENDKGQEAMARLKSAMEELISKSGRSGKIVKRKEELKKARVEYDMAVLHNERADGYKNKCDIIERAIEFNSICRKIDKIDEMLDGDGIQDGGGSGSGRGLIVPSLAVILISLILSMVSIYACAICAVSGLAGLYLGMRRRKSMDANPLEQKLLDEKSQLISEKNLIKVSEKYRDMPIKELKQILKECRMKSAPVSGVDKLGQKADELSCSIKRMEEYYSSLKMAYEVMEDIQCERRRGFGPAVNKKASEIFSIMTGGSYSSVMVGNDYNAKVLGDKGIKSIDWKYLSSGTADQLYLAMRLAVSRLMGGQESFPVLMDDALERFDDERLEETLKYLKDYGSSTQLILFTCHGNVLQILKNVSEGRT